LVGDSRQGKVNEQMIGRAIEQYKKLSELVPKETETWLTLGRLYKLAQNSVESEAAYKKVLELEPDHEEALIGLAMVYSDLGDQPRASEMLSRVVARNPSVRTLTALGRRSAAAGTCGRPSFSAGARDGPGQHQPEVRACENLLLADKVEESLKAFRTGDGRSKDYRAQLRISQIHRQQKKPAAHGR
jgi:tetratricopeptide (TPR) repeat protein